MARKSTRLPAPHFLFSSTVNGWLVCMCRCGYAAVCLYCVPTASSDIPTCLCDAEERRFHAGRSAIASDDTHTTSHERK